MYKYVCVDTGVTIDNEEEAKEWEIQKKVYCNLLKLCLEKIPSKKNAGGTFHFLITNKKDVIQLLELGNLDTVYAPRSFVKKEGA